jgi:plastocyanin
MLTRQRIILVLLLPAIVALFALSTSPASAQETVTVDIGDTYFCDASFQGGTCTTTISAGDTVSWGFGGSLPHTVTDCGGNCASPTGSPAFDSGQMSSGTYQHTFDTAGTYGYYCQVHGASVMQGQIVVQGAQQPTTPATTVATTPADGAGDATATPGTIVAPSTGGATPGGSDGSWWWLAALAAAGAALTGLGAVAYRLKSYR